MIGLSLGLSLDGNNLSPASIATNSLVLASASSQYLSATGKTNVNQQKFTFAAWIKRADALTTAQTLYSFSDGTTTNRIILVLSNNKLDWISTTAGVQNSNLLSTQTITDTTTWHHVMVAVDTTQATANNRVILYLDGAQAALDTNSQPAQNTNFSNNFAVTNYIGARISGGVVGQFYNGKFSQVYYIDGQQLAPASFITGTPGLPKNFAGTYTGVFDFFLPFSNAGSLGADSSGEGNNWTPVNTPTQSSDHP